MTGGRWPAFVVSGALLAACASPLPNHNADRLAPDGSPRGPVAIYDPASGRIPLPNDLLFVDPETGIQDTRLHVPVPAGASPLLARTVQDLNRLDGFSAQPSITIDFDKPVDSTTLRYDPSQEFLGSNTVVFFREENGLPVEFPPATLVLDADGKRLHVVPEDLLLEKSRYFVLVKQGVKGTAHGDPAVASPLFYFLLSRDPLVTADGRSVTPLLTDAQARQIEALRVAYAPLFGGLERLLRGQFTRNVLVAAWAFTVQSITSDMDAIRARMLSDAAASPPRPTWTSSAPPDPEMECFPGVVTGGPGCAIVRVLRGTYLSPRYVGSDDTFVDPLPADGFPKPVPFLLTIPSAPTRAVLLFQHGLGGRKEDLFRFANAAAGIGFATIGIDALHHGERVVDLPRYDLNGDGRVDSGEAFLNPADIAMSRDNIRQTVVDQQALVRLIEDLGFPGMATHPIFYLGQSLGGILGALFVPLESDLQGAVLNVPGAGLTKLISNSATFGPSTRGALAQAFGLDPASPEFQARYAELLADAQWLVDRGDPIYWASRAKDRMAGAAPTLRILVQEVQDDQVVANVATEWLASEMGLVPDFAPGPADFTTPGGIMRFIRSDHGVLFSTSTTPPLPAVSAEMQSQILSFLASWGTEVTLTDATVVLPSL